MKTEKAEKIWNNHLNGNLLEFKQQIKKLTKIELLDFIWFLYDNNFFNNKEALYTIRKALE